MKAKKSYNELKADARARAIDWQNSQEPQSWGEIAETCDYFERLGRRYGLLREFRENAII